MKKINKGDLGQEVYDLFDSYVHSKISRRDFMDRVSQYAVGGLTAAAILDYLSPQYAVAQQVRAGDTRLDEQYVEYPSPQGGGTIKGLLATPAGNDAKLPGVVVVHENRGLNPHIEDVCRQARLETHGRLLLRAPALAGPLHPYHHPRRPVRANSEGATSSLLAPKNGYTTCSGIDSTSIGIWVCWSSGWALVWGFCFSMDGANSSVGRSGGLV